MGWFKGNLKLEVRGKLEGKKIEVFEGRRNPKLKILGFGFGKEGFRVEEEIERWVLQFRILVFGIGTASSWV